MDPSKVFKAPLTLEQLHDIGQRNRDHADVKALLWEIRRLHATVLRADQVCRSAVGGSVPTVLMDAMRKELAEEPIVQDRVKLWNPQDPADDR